MKKGNVKQLLSLVAVSFRKPRKDSKEMDHQECLAKRLEQWKEGGIDILMREG